MNPHDLITRKPPEPWIGCKKIPWNESDFSRRMFNDVGFSSVEELIAAVWSTGDDFNEKLQTHFCSKMTT